MILHFDNKEIDMVVSDSSYRYRAIKGEHSLTLYVSLPVFIEIPVGAWCEYQGQIYTLEKPANFKMNGIESYDYTLILDSPAAKLNKYKFRNIIDRRLKFSLTGKPVEHLQLLVDNLNQRDGDGGEWKVGICLDAADKPISYNHTFCNEALQMIADAFETEWEINNKTISLRKVEYNKENPLVLSYGRGKGFKKGIGRENNDDSKVVEILYVQGGDRNIDASKYGSKELLLPKNQQLVYEGRTYITDSDGYSMRRADIPLKTFEEDSIDLSHIYPSRVGEVSKIEVADADKNFYDFFDSSIPDALDYEQYIIAGETMTVIFQSGMLAGEDKEFEVKYNHKERRFQIVPQEIDGRTMPDGVYSPKIGDKYAVFGCMLPNEYFCDNKSQTGGSWDMFREAVKYKYEHEERRYNFTGELDGIWAKRDWLNIGGKIVLGGYVQFTADFVPDGVLIRIVGVKEMINNPYSPTIELSNTTTGTSITSDLLKIEQNEVIAEDNRKEVLQFAKRRFRDAQETMGMIQDSLLHFSGAINPITVQTMFMLVGDESLQFQFVNNKTNPKKVTHSESYDKGAKIFSCAGGIIQHMTLGIDSMASKHAPSEYKFWDMKAFNSPPLTEASEKYYLYAKVVNGGTTGEFRMSETAVAMDGEPGYYHLLLGIINSEYDGDRSYTPMYGFTEIAPGRMTIDRIVAPDASGYWDFINKAFKLGNALSFNTQGDKKLRLKGTLLQSESGDESVAGVFRGDYDNMVLYYAGDEIVYYGSTYRCLQPCPTAGIMPTNATYWKLVAAKGGKGDKGDKGDVGDAGMDAAVALFRGNYSSSSIYYGNDSRTDLVFYNKIYYKAKRNAGTFQNVIPTNTDYWENFGAQFDSIATGLLLAENANIANLIFKDEMLVSQAKTNGVPNIQLAGKTGVVRFAADKFRVDENSNIFMEGRISTPLEIITPPSGTKLYRDIAAKDLIMEYTNNPGQAKKLIITGDVYDGMEFNLVINSKEQYVTDRVPIEVMGTTQWYDIARQFTVSIQTGENGKEYYVACVQSSYAFVTFKWLSYFGKWMKISEFYGIEPSTILQ